MIINASIHHILNTKMRKSVIGFLGSLDPFKRQCALIDAPYSIILLFVPANYFMSDDFTCSTEGLNCRLQVNAGCRSVQVGLNCRLQVNAG
jgi:hypothetical protein